jgi:hypothetical protein
VGRVLEALYRASILKRACPPKPNFTRQEREALRELQENKGIYIVLVDKGNATVLLDSLDYSNRIHTVLSDPIYEPTNRNPIKQVERQTKKLIQQSSVPVKTQKLLIPKHTRTPAFYSLPKIHKPDVALRPIVSATGSPTHNLTRYLHRLLPTIPCPASYIQYSHVQLLSQFTLAEDNILVSFDVESLFSWRSSGST